MLTQPKAFDDQREMNKCKGHDVEFVESGEDPTEAFEAMEQPLNLATVPGNEKAQGKKLMEPLVKDSTSAWEA